MTKDGAPNNVAKDTFPSEIDSLLPEQRKFIFHDEPTFNPNDDEGLQWGTADIQLIRSKSSGSGIMVTLLQNRMAFYA